MDFIMKHEFDSEAKRWEITLNGEIDIFNSPEFKNKLLELLAEKPGGLHQKHDYKHRKNH